MAVLVGKHAPDFTAKAVMPDNKIEDAFNLHHYIKGSNAILFFYPLDFTFVCPSEILAFNKKLAEFTKRNTKVISVSIDSHFTHLAYKNTPTTSGGIGQIEFPMVADLKKSIAADYDVLWDESIALRGTFLIDKKGMVRHQTVNDLPLGRNVDEMLRMVDALDHHEQHGEVCPANWTPSKRAMKPSSEGVIIYLSSNLDDI
jgi:peroxiredoxin (alkyl hydroperoxide reductase subunit C)